jgi:hypothetical protein
LGSDEISMSDDNHGCIIVWLTILRVCF